jgi:nucleoside-diphosphate-sugar epimerase
MNSLIIGSSSIIGSAIADDLSQLGLVQTAGRRNADFELDLLASDSLPAIDKRFDTVIMVAADFGGPTESDFLRATGVNVLGAIKAVSIASQVGAKQFVLISSISACYKPHEDYYNAYALTKFQSEQAAAFACDQHKIDLSIIRPSAVFDTQGKCRHHQKLFYAILDSAREGKDFTIAGSADPLRNFVHITDVASLVSHVITEAKVGTFVCAQPESLPISVIAKTAYTVFGNGGHVNFDRSKPDIATSRPLLDGSEGDTNWKPSITIEEGMRMIQKNGNGDA